MCDGKINFKYLYKDKTISKEMREQIDRVKNWKQFLNENYKLSVKQTINSLQSEIDNIFNRFGFNDFHLIWKGQTNYKNQAKLDLITNEEHKIKNRLIGGEKETEYIKRWRECVLEIDKLLETKFTILYKNIGDSFRIVELRSNGDF